MGGHRSAGLFSRSRNRGSGTPYRKLVVVTFCVITYGVMCRYNDVASLRLTHLQFHRNGGSVTPSFPKRKNDQYRQGSKLRYLLWVMSTIVRSLCYECYATKFLVRQSRSRFKVFKVLSFGPILRGPTLMGPRTVTASTRGICVND